MAQKTRAELQSLKDANLASSQPGGIIALQHREVVGDGIDSAFIKLTDDFTDIPGLQEQLGNVPGSQVIKTNRVAVDSTTDGTSSAWAITDTSVPRTLTIGTVDEILDNVIRVKDESGGAASNNITIDTQGVSLINGQPFIVMATGGDGVQLKFDGTNWHDWPNNILVGTKNFVQVDDLDKLPAPSGGEILLPPLMTFDITTNPVTGLPPVFTSALRTTPGPNNNKILQTQTHLPVSYTGAGAFIRAADLGALNVEGVVFNPSEELFDLTGIAVPNAHLAATNIVVVGGTSYGSFNDNLDLTMFNCTAFARTGSIKLNNVLAANINGITVTQDLAAIGPIFEVMGQDIRLVNIIGGLFEPSNALNPQSVIRVSPDLGEDSIIEISSNAYSSAEGGDFFESGISGTIISAADNSETGSILSFADNGSGGTTVTSTAALPAAIVDTRKITMSGTTGYNETKPIFNTTGTTFDVDIPFTGDDATGTWDFLSVTFTTGAAHAQIDGTPLQIEKSFHEYNLGRTIFDASGSVFSMDDILFQSPGGALTGNWATALLQDDRRFLVTNNGDQIDTAQLIAADVTSPEIITIATAGIAVPITTWIARVARQWTPNAPEEPVGTNRFEGKKVIQDHKFMATGRMVSGGLKEVSLELWLKPHLGIFSQVGEPVVGTFGGPSTKTTLTGFVGAVDTNELDVLQIRIANSDDITAIEIVRASDASVTVARGF